jgi:hypothetical protein
MLGTTDLLFLVASGRGRYRHPLSLASHHTRVYSQNGEDGIIAEIFRRIGVRDRCFVEIGTESGGICNTRLLLEQGWRGLWIDSNSGEARQTFAEYLRPGGTLCLIEANVTAENINELLDSHGVPATFDFLSLDIDQNTSHVWRALNRRSRVACIEYNASIPASLALEVPYDPQCQWDLTNWYGGSLKALERIGITKQMSLVGCELHGINSFFVARKEARRHFQKPFTAEQHWEPPRYGEDGHRASPVARRWYCTPP